MDEISISRYCRQTIRDRRYTPERSTSIIQWLRHENAAISDLAGRAIGALGAPAFNDLLQRITASGIPSPNEVWALTLVESEDDRLLPLLRHWLANSTGELERQCAVGLAAILIARKRASLTPDPSDVRACLQVLERDARENPAMRVYMRGFLKALAD
jgi:hypothetical protein